MILAAGLTPAWQQIMRFDAFEPGEVNRASEVHWCASGKVLNVAIGLAHLGADCRAVALLGGPPGELIEREFATLGIAREWIRSESATRICTTILDDSNSRTTELVENAGPVTAAELDDFRRAYRDQAAQATVAVLSGSLPAGVGRSYYRDLLAGTRCPVVIDARGEELLLALEQRPFLVKPNREELSQTVGRRLDDDRALRGAMRELNERGATWVVVSQGKADVWLSSQDGFFRIQPPRVAVINPIGSGDCLAAGIAARLAGGAEPVEAVRFGVAAATFNVGQLLPARLDPIAIEAIAQTMAVESR